MSRLLPSLLAAAGLLAITAYIGSSAYAAHSAGSINGSTTVTGDFGPPQGPPIEEKLVAPPGVPAPIHRDHPARVIVRLETQEVVKEIADGVRYNFWTFNGTTPSPERAIDTRLRHRGTRHDDVRFRTVRRPHRKRMS